jgi:hypothetical protein
LIVSIVFGGQSPEDYTLISSVLFTMLLKISWVLSILTLCHGLSRQKRIVGGYPALVPESNGFNISKPPQKMDSTIQMQDDYRSATIIGVEEPEGYYAYKGIRYAEPPTGRLRFQVW